MAISVSPASGLSDVTVIVCNHSELNRAHEVVNFITNGFRELLEALDVPSHVLQCSMSNPSTDTYRFTLSVINPSSYGTERRILHHAISLLCHTARRRLHQGQGMRSYGEVAWDVGMDGQKELPIGNDQYPRQAQLEPLKYGGRRVRIRKKD